MEDRLRLPVPGAGLVTKAVSAARQVRPGGEVRVSWATAKSLALGLAGPDCESTQPLAQASLRRVCVFQRVCERACVYLCAGGCMHALARACLLACVSAYGCLRECLLARACLRVCGFMRARSGLCMVCVCGCICARRLCARVSECAVV